MCRSVFRIESESREHLRATLKALLAKEGPTGMEDAKLIAAIREELNTRALGTYDETGFPKALYDDPDPFTW